jgi:YfiH family protein
MTSAPYLTDPRLAAVAGIRHGFFTRAGGVSDGIYASLNCGIGSSDDPGRVAENRGRVAAALGAGPADLVTPYQVHGTDAITVDGPSPGDARPHADALVTDRPGIAIAIGTADCGPILLADTAAHVIGAAHAGWRGALSGIVESAVAAMERLGARRERIVAALGPSISQANYEVGPELVERFVADDPANRRFFMTSARPGHSRFDLPGYTIVRLERAGVAAVNLGPCTYADEARFYSFRRATHRGEKDYGRQLSVIMLTA